MSKERFERMKRHAIENDDKCQLWLIEQAEQNIDLAVAYDNATKDIQVLENKNKKQAERVHELEGTLKWEKSYEKRNLFLEQQNMRYRDLLVKAHSHKGISPQLREELNKALRSESE